MIKAFSQESSSEHLDTIRSAVNQIEAQEKPGSALHAVARMIRSVTLYLASSSASAKPEALPVLTALGQNAQQLIDQADTLDRQKTSQLFDHSMAVFKSLKQKIATRPVFTKDQMEELHSVILSIDWEITDQTLKDFEITVNRLMTLTRSESMYYAFLKLIQSLGRYIGTRKSAAHNDSIPLLRSIASAFETVVLSAGMTIPEKKQLLSDCLEQFKAFKTSIRVPSMPADPVDTAQENVAPALSHLSGQPGLKEDDLELTPLTEVREPEASLNDLAEDISPALSGKPASPAPARDVMDDLFTVKETPADHLLDAIHLMNVHGNNEEQALKMLDQSDSSQADNVHNFTLQRSDTRPIPEIGSRLDAFFNLDAGGNGQPLTPAPESVPPAALSNEEAIAEPGIVPFEYDDDASLHLAEGEDARKTVQGAEHRNLKALMDVFSTPGWETDRSCLQEILTQSRRLEALWEDDADKTGLVDVIQSLSQALVTACPGSEENGLSELPDNGEAAPKKGMLAKFKSMFSS